MIPFTMRFALPVDSGVGLQKALAQYDPATESLVVSDAGVRKLAIEQPFARATFGSVCTNSLLMPPATNRRIGKHRCGHQRR